jgi:pyruvate,water dikinase
MFIKNLNNSNDLSDMGNKCKNLALLTEYGFNVPEAYGVTFISFKKFINPLINEIKKIIYTNSYKEAALKIRELIMSSEIPDEVLNQIEFVTNKFTSDTVFAVRSSGMAVEKGIIITEDSATKSLAGQYESYLNVPLIQVPTAIKLCWSSLFNERSLQIFQAKTNDTFLESSMSVVVQKMINADYSAVVMTLDPLSNENLLAMESTYGACEAIVSGKVTGDLISVNRENREIHGMELGSKKNKVVYDVFNEKNRGEYKLENIEGNLQKQFAIGDEMILKIHDVGLAIEKKFNHPQDIELVIKDNEIFITQTRNITATINIKN